MPPPIRCCVALIGANVELVTLPAEQACFVAVDPTELDQALLNLAVNARDAMPEAAALTISHRSSTTRADASYAFLKVADTGCGIVSGIVPRLFEPFFTTKAVGSGTGLGLAMVRDFVGSVRRLDRGRHRPDEGTSFTSAAFRRRGTGRSSGSDTEAETAGVAPRRSC